MTQWIARVTRVHIILIVAATACFFSTFAYLQSLDKTINVAQLSRDVTAGATISKDDVAYVAIPHDALLESQFLTLNQINTLGVVARTDLSRSDLLTINNTIRRTDSKGLQSLSMGIAIDRANGGDIAKGDIVDIWRTGETAGLVTASVPVRNVILPNKKLGISTSQAITVVLAVTPQQAQQLSRIVGIDDVMIVLANGTKTSDVLLDDPETPPTEQAGQYKPIDLGTHLSE